MCCHFVSGSLCLCQFYTHVDAEGLVGGGGGGCYADEDAWE